MHNVGVDLRRPYWLDESWVADAVRAPWGNVPLVTSSTPLGWTFLLKVVPGLQSGEHGRLLAIAFCGLAAAAGYLLGEQLGFRRHLTGALCGIAVLLSPAMLVRNDLKQYTAEAFASVLLVALAVGVERAWTTRGMVALAVAVPITFVIGTTAAFIAVCVYLVLLTEAAWHRRDRFRTLVVTAAAAAVVTAVEYALAVAPDVIPILTRYWDSYYIPTRSVGGATHDIDVRYHQLAPWTGFANPILLAVVGFLSVAVCALARRWVVAAVVPLAAVVNLAAAVARKYPFGDARTSTWLTVLVPVVVAAAVSALADLVRVRGTSAAGRVGPVAAALAVMVAGVGWVGHNARLVRAVTLYAEDVRDEARYVDVNLRPGDVVVVDRLASFGFAYYDTRATAGYRADGTLTTGFLPVFDQSWVVQVTSTDPGAVASAVKEALARVAAGSGQQGGQVGRVWVVRTHMSATVAAEWKAALTGLHVTSIDVGPDRLLKVEPGP